MTKQVHDQMGRTIDPEDFHVKVDKVLREALKKAEAGEVHAVALVLLNSDGKPVCASSIGTPQTINLLEQGLEIARGEREPADD